MVRKWGNEEREREREREWVSEWVRERASRSHFERQKKRA